jgi:hypothetical protein
MALLIKLRKRRGTLLVKSPMEMMGRGGTQIMKTAKISRTLSIYSYSFVDCMLSPVGFFQLK